MLRLILTLLIVTPSAYALEDKPGFANETGLSYVVTGGNSSSETTSLNQKFTYAWTRDILKFTGHYIQVTGKDPESDNDSINSENWSSTVRFEKVINPKVFNAFVAHGWYGDRFQGVRYGHSTDIGAKYYFLNTDNTDIFSELGYRYTRELLVRTPSTKVGAGNPIMPEYHYARLYTQVDYQYSKSFSLGAWIEYLPSIVNFAEDQRLNYSPYLTSVLTEIFSLKVSYEGRYRYKPAVEGNKLTDYTFMTSLIAKF